MASVRAKRMTIYAMEKQKILRKIPAMDSIGSNGWLRARYPPYENHAGDYSFLQTRLSDGQTPAHPPQKKAT
jgi:hypothetical protein